MNGAMIIFLFLLLHIFRAFWYSSFSIKTPWILGVFLYILMIFIAFLGYNLPFGQMSYWGGTVITNMLTTIPIIGEYLKIYIWGDYNIGFFTLKRFYSFHFFLPFLLILLILLHIYTLHNNGGNNPLGLKDEVISFHPYFSFKDFFSTFFSFTLLFFFVFFFPSLLGHVDNFIPANPIVTPNHIVPELYLLPYYAILKSIPSKSFGVIAMILALFLLIPFPYFQPSTFLNLSFRPLFLSFFLFFSFNFLFLGYLGTLVVVPPFSFLSSLFTFFYFYFFFFSSLLSFFEFFFFFL